MPTLHWFALSDGEYWLQAGEQRLLEYSAEVQKRAGFPPHCDYQLARLHEDLSNMLGDVLEPIPKELEPLMLGATKRQWMKRRVDWVEQHFDPDSDDDWKILGAADEWRRLRWLDTLYLSPGADIHIWSDARQVHFAWDHGEILKNDLPVWSAREGCWSISREHFLVEVQQFHHDLMAAMAQRVDAVHSGALDALIDIDLAGLVADQLMRSQWIARSPELRSTPTDWAAVTRAVQHIS